MSVQCEYHEVTDSLLGYIMRMCEGNHIISFTHFLSSLIGSSPDNYLGEYGTQYKDQEFHSHSTILLRNHHNFNATNSTNILRLHL